MATTAPPSPPSGAAGTTAVAQTPHTHYVLRGANLARFLWEGRHDPLEPICRLPGAPGVVRIPDPFANLFLIRSPQDTRHVLIANQDAYGKGTDYRVLGVLLGNGLLTNADPVFWQRQRKLVQPMFAKRHLAPMATHMTAAATDWLAKWDAKAAGAGTPVDAHAAMNALTLDVVDRALFGTGVDDATTQTVGAAMTDVLHAGSYYLKTGYITRALMSFGMDLNTALRTRPRPWRRAMRAIDTLDGVVAQMIAAYEADPEPDPHNLLALLLSARDEDTGAPMDREQVRDEVMTFLGAGHETTANALSWMFLLLSQHPDVRERLQAEVDEVLAGRTPAAEDVDALPYTMAVLQESMRLYPPVPAITRIALEDDVVGGARVPKGSGVLILPYVIHRDPELWPNPEGFDPRRFLTPEQGGTMTPDRPKQAFMPFGAGRRICVGSGFALMEGVLLAAMITQRFELDLQPGVRVTPEIAITLRPEGSLPMVLRRRAG